MCREVAPLKFTSELWGALRGNVTDLADWISDQNRLGGSTNKDGLKRKIKRVGNLLSASFVTVDMAAEREERIASEAAAVAKKAHDAAAAAHDDLVERYGKREEVKTSPPHGGDRLPVLAAVNKAASRSHVIAMKNQSKYDKTRQIAEVRSGVCPYEARWP